MAESQGGFEYTAEITERLQSTISPGRFARYLGPAVDATAAIQWYLYNARLAKSLLFPLHLLEVALRNSFDSVLSAVFGKNWPWSQGFRDALTSEGAAALLRAIQYSTRKKATPTAHDVVTELTFDFWSNLFRPAYARAPWTARFTALFPHDGTLTVRKVQIMVTEINSLRNRIAHHEPIFDSPTLIQTYDHLLVLLNGLDPNIHRWGRRHSTFVRMQRTKPSASGVIAPTARQTCDRTFAVVPASQALDQLNPQNPYLCTDAKGAVTAVVTMADLAAYTMSAQQQAGSLIDFADHQLENVIAHGKLRNNFMEVPGDLPLLELNHWFKKKNKPVALVISAGTRAIDGYILRAHRRY